MSETGDKPSVASGLAKLGLGAIIGGPIGTGYALKSALTDRDTAETLEASNWGGIKAAAGSFGLNATRGASAAAGAAGMARDFLSGDTGEDSAGKVMARDLRGEIRRVEEEHPNLVAAGGASALAGMSMLGGYGGAAGLTTKLGQRLATRVAPRAGTLGGQAAAGALTGAESTAEATFVDDINKQALDGGDVDYAKAIGAVAKNWKGVVLGGAVGLALPVVGKGIGRMAESQTLKKAADKADDVADDLFLRESGLSAQQRKELKGEVGERLKSVIGEVRNNKAHGAGVVDDLNKKIDGELEFGRSSLRDRIRTVDEQAEKFKLDRAAKLQQEADGVRASLSDDFLKKAAPLDDRLQSAEAAHEAVREKAFGLRQEMMDEVAAIRAANDPSALRAKLAKLHDSKKEVSEVFNLGGAKGEETVGRRVETTRVMREDTMASPRDPGVGPGRQARRVSIDNEATGVDIGAGRAKEAARQSEVDAIKAQIASMEEASAKAEASAIATFERKIAQAEKELERSYRTYDKHVGRVAAKKERLTAEFADRFEKEAGKLSASAQDDIARYEAEIGKYRDDYNLKLAELDPANLDHKKLDKLLADDPLGMDRLALKDALLRRRGVEAIGEAKSSSLAHEGFSLLQRGPTGPRASLLGMGWRKGPLAAAGGAVGGSIGGWPGAAVGAAVGASGDALLARVAPHYASNGLRGVGNLARTIHHTATMDQVVRGAVRSLFGERLPIFAGQLNVPEAPLSGHKDPAKALAAHSAALESVSNNPDRFEAAVNAAASSLPPDGRAQASAKLGTIMANLRRKAPKPAIDMNPVFRALPRYSDTEMRKYEDYLRIATSPVEYAKAVRGRYVTPEMTESLRDNWPEVADQFRDEFLNSLADGEVEDTQSVRQLEMVLGEAILPENKPENTKFFQNFYDASNREKQSGGQGGGTPRGARKSVQSTRLPADGAVE